tara:strand:- start:11084 stop:11716 length:633 start_codon:yes stop_codon:yes gene_type:complete
MGKNPRENKMKGQINLENKAGKYIFDICRREDVKTILEIGTWNGQGSTFCVYSAINATEKKLLSIETNQDMYLAACDIYSGKREVEILNGHISDELIDFESLDSSFFTDYSKPAKYSWYSEDSLSIENTPNVLESMPEQIDFLILDGGEFSSWSEYKLLKDRSKIIFLDDTRPPTIKNYRARKDLLSSKNYKLIIDDLDSRNGFCIFEKI